MQEKGTNKKKRDFYDIVPSKPSLFFPFGCLALSLSSHSALISVFLSKLLALMQS